MSQHDMKHTEWNYIIWFTLLGWSDRILKLRLTKLQLALVNSWSPLLQDIRTENISLSDKFWMSVKLERYLIKWSLGFSYAVQDIIKINSSLTNPLSQMVHNLFSRGVLLNLPVSAECLWELILRRVRFSRLTRDTWNLCFSRKKITFEKGVWSWLATIMNCVQPCLLVVKLHHRLEYSGWVTEGAAESSDTMIKFVKPGFLIKELRL